MMLLREIDLLKKIINNNSIKGIAKGFIKAVSVVF